VWLEAVVGGGGGGGGALIPQIFGVKTIKFTRFFFFFFFAVIIESSEYIIFPTDGVATT